MFDNTHTDYIYSFFHVYILHIIIRRICASPKYFYQVLDLSRSQVILL